MERRALRLRAVVCAGVVWASLACTVSGCASGDFRLAERGDDPLNVTMADAAPDTVPDTASSVDAVDDAAEETSAPPDAAVADTCAGSIAVDLQTTLVDAKLTASVSRSREHAITHRLRRAGAIRAVTLLLSRNTYQCPIGGSDCGSPDPACSMCTSSGSGSCTCSVTTATVGAITLDVVAGAPGSGGAVLATSAVSLASIGSGETSVRFTLATSALSAGTNVHFRLRTDSTAWQLTMYGSIAGTPPLGVAWWRRTIYPPGAWMGDDVFTPVMRVEIEHCD